MNFDFDDNLIPSKRKNINPVRFTNVLIIAGFVVLAGLMIFFMNGNKSSSISEADIQATVDARVTRALENLPDTDPEIEVAVIDAQLTQIPASPLPIPTLAEPIIQEPVIIEGKELFDGMMVKGNITDSDYEQDYFYQGKAGTAIVILMTGEKTDAYFEEPEILLTAPNDRKLLASVNINQPIGNFRQALIAVVLPIDGVYSITASRKDGRVGKEKGSYTLTLDVPPMLEMGKTIEGIIGGKGHWNWYVYQSDQPFGVVYQHLAGTYLPEVGVYTLNGENALQGIGYITGDKTTFGQLGWYDSKRMHFVTVGESISTVLSDVENREGSTAQYQIGIIQEATAKE